MIPPQAWQQPPTVQGRDGGQDPPPPAAPTRSAQAAPQRVRRTRTAHLQVERLTIAQLREENAALRALLPVVRHFDPNPARAPVVRVADALQAAIGHGDLPAGAVLPSARDLGAALGVNFMVAVHAMRDLHDQGLVEQPRAGARMQVTSDAQQRLQTQIPPARSSDPLHVQIAGVVQAAINDGTYQSTLPSAAQIASALEVGVPAVQGALRLLHNQGVIQVGQGHPTRVINGPRPATARAAAAFTRPAGQMRAPTRSPGTGSGTRGPTSAAPANQPVRSR